RAFATLARLGDLDARRTMHEANASFFTDPRVRQLFDRRATYAGSSPYLAPATLNVIQHVDYAMGGFVVEGGVRSLARALVRLAEKRGVRLHLDTPVEGILTDSGGVNGVAVEGERLAFDAVVSNADVNVTYRDLLGDTRSRPARRYANLEPSSSAVVFYWGVRGSHPRLDVHNILFSADYRAEFEDLFVNHTCPRDPTIYIYLSCRYVPDDAPEGCENWFVMINAPHDRGQDWAAEVDRTRETLLRRLRERLGVDIEPRIEEEAVLDPPELQRRTASRHGSIYGISSNSQWAAFQRQRNRSRHHRGLYFCGGSAHPGGGMPLVMLSGKMAAEHVREDLQGR
ncbi:MAG: phytoene desaturase family protein, partial [Armatimonadota bacterium]